MMSFGMTQSLILLMLCIMASVSKAFDICTSGFEVLTCHDNGSSIGYCCDEQDKLYLIHYKCCFYTAWWGRWYIYLAIGVGLGILTCLTKCCTTRQNTRNNLPTYNQINAQAEIPVAPPTDEDTLPTYEQAIKIGKCDELEQIHPSHHPSYGSYQNST